MLSPDSLCLLLRDMFIYDAASIRTTLLLLFELLDPLQAFAGLPQHRRLVLSKRGLSVQLEEARIQCCCRNE